MFSDEELTAYLDGELDQAKALAIERALASDSGLAARLHGLALDKDALRDAFRPLLEEAPDDLILSVVPIAPATPARGDLPAPMAAMAASVMLAIGLGVGWALFSPVDNWQTEVAHYQALYVADTLMPIAPDEARISSELAVASAKLGLELPYDILNSYDGLTLRRAQVLGYEGQTLVQVAFTTSDGSPIAFCILTKSDSAQSALKSEILSGLATTSWQKGTHGFLTIGGQDKAQMQDFASYLKAAI